MINLQFYVKSTEKDMWVLFVIKAKKGPSQSDKLDKTFYQIPFVSIYFDTEDWC